MPLQLLRSFTSFPDHSHSLTRNESEKIMESGSSAEESDEEEDGNADDKVCSALHDKGSSLNFAFNIKRV